MSYLLDGQTIRAPYQMSEANSTQVAQNRTLDGSINRDYFGSNKRMWVLEYSNTKKTAYDTIKAIYDSYLTTGDSKTWEVTETNYTISQTNVHIDLEERGFTVRGSDYISDFTLTLTEV
jgi:hypothetical protein